ncbi:MAG: enoyl-CoA hydratase/isomerase family protein, partial [Dehalococcoidia bacterium]|nr:enoyl-CoA hydratase/isomerase family protein [Dehalococcoidia bacterium]
MALLYDKKDKIVTITFNRPEAMNAFSVQQTKEFSEALLQFREDRDAWVAILTGAGDEAFSAGADLKEIVPLSVSKGHLDYLAIHIARGMNNLDKPIIAAANGITVGAGMEVALACDMIIASERASFGLPEVKWGVIPGWGGTQRLARKIPRNKAAEMVMTGVSIDAKEAYRLGLVNAVVPHDQLMAEARKMAEKICRNAPLAIRAVK